MPYAQHGHPRLGVRTSVTEVERSKLASTLHQIPAHMVETKAAAAATRRLSWVLAFSFALPIASR